MRHYKVKLTKQNKTKQNKTKVKDIIYDIDTKQFKDLSNGKQFTDDDFGRLAKTEPARRNRAGSNTLKRSAIANTILAQPRGEARNRIVVGLIKLGRESSLLNTQLTRTFYSKGKAKSSGITKQEFTSTLKQAFGDKVAERLLAKNIITLLALNLLGVTKAR